MSYNPVSIDEYQRLLAENERLRAEAVEADEATARMFNLARDLRDEMEGHAEADLARVRALEAECEGHKEAFASMLAEAELCGSVNEDLQARVAALEEALRGAMKKLQRYGEQTEDESAALARPTPTPQGEKGERNA